MEINEDKKIEIINLLNNIFSESPYKRKQLIKSLYEMNLSASEVFPELYNLLRKEEQYKEISNEFLEMLFVNTKDYLIKLMDKKNKQKTLGYEKQNSKNGGRGGIWTGDFILWNNNSIGRAL